MSIQPLVSIGLPTYNRASILKRAIESVLTQDYQNIELVISDNGSTDETEGICLEASRLDGRVKYFRQHSNQGAIENFREVLRRSSGEFFMWLGDDDLLDRSYVGRCARTLVAALDYTLVCGKTKYFQGEHLARHGVMVNLSQDRGTDRVLAYYGLVGDNGTFYGLMRRDDMLDVPLRNSMGGDWLFIAAMALKGKIRTLDDVYMTRSLGGTSDSFEKIATALGLSSFAATHPYLSIAASAFRDIAWSSPAYSECGIGGRLSLAYRVFALVARRADVTFKQLARETAFVVMTKLLPASIVTRIRNRRRRRRAEAGL
jgi:glycosyltransferase involved in cell wall biosynthesis